MESHTKHALKLWTIISRWLIRKVRAVHRLVQVRFVPNLKLTRPRQVSNIQTHRFRRLKYQLVLVNGWSNSRKKKNAKMCRKWLKSGQNWSKSARSGQNMAGSSETSKGTHQILKRSQQINREMFRNSLYL